MINNGDLVDHGDLEEQWHWMFGAAENELLNTPIVPVLGGHEIKDYDGDLTTDNRNFYNHFNLPKQVVEGTHEGSVILLNMVMHFFWLLIPNLKVNSLQTEKISKGPIPNSGDK